MKVKHGEYSIRRKTFSVFCGNNLENLHGRTNFQQNISKLSYNNFSWKKKLKAKILQSPLGKNTCVYGGRGGFGGGGDSGKSY